MNHYAITITRQFGSLGRPIAKRLAEKLGIEYYDRDIVEQVSKETGLSVHTISDAEESAGNRFWKMKFPLGTPGTNVIQDHIFEVQKKIILELAEKEDCIIVGRCSDYVLRDHDQCIRVYIYADTEQRMKNCVNTLHLEPHTASKMMKDVDKARELYHIRYAGYFPNDEEHQDIMLNSGFLGVDGTADALEILVKKKLQIGKNPDMTD